MMVSKLLTIGEAAKLLGLTEGGAAYALGDPDDMKKAGNGFLSKAWLRTKVMKVRQERLKAGKVLKVREETHKHRFRPGPKKKKVDYFELDRFGNVVPMKRVYRGSVCRSEGCSTPVASGFLYCDDHRLEFEAMRKNVSTHGDSYSCHVRV